LGVQVEKREGGVREAEKGWEEKVKKSGGNREGAGGRKFVPHPPSLSIPWPLPHSGRIFFSVNTLL